jgi:hypothetical protein
MPGNWVDEVHAVPVVRQPFGMYAWATADVRDIQRAVRKKATN